jgi:hypothetical protein
VSASALPAWSTRLGANGRAADRPDGARQPGHHQRRGPLQQRLLRDDPARVGDRRDQAQSRAPARGDAVGGGRQPDDRDAGERDRATRHQRAGEALAQQPAGEQRDQDRADVDEHRGRAGIHSPLGLVQRDVVDPEPQHAAHHQPRQIAPRRQRFAADEHDDPEDHAADQQPPERQRAPGQLLTGRPDPDERARPQQDRHDAGGKRSHAGETRRGGDS